MASPQANRVLNEVNGNLSKEQFNGVVYTASPLFSNDKVQALVDVCIELKDCCDDSRDDVVLLLSVILELIGERKHAERLKQSITGPVRYFKLEEGKYIDEDALQKVKVRGLIVRMCRKLRQNGLEKFARNVCLQLNIRYDNYPGFELFKYLEKAGHLRPDSPDGLSVIMNALDSDSEFKAVADFIKKGDNFLIVL